MQKPDRIGTLPCQVVPSEIAGICVGGNRNPKTGCAAIYHSGKARPYKSTFDHMCVLANDC